MGCHIYPAFPSTASACCVSLRTAGPNIAARSRTMPISSTWRRGRGSRQDQGEQLADQRDLRTLSPHHQGRVLRHRLPQEALPVRGGIAGGSGRMTGQIQRAAAAIGTIQLWQNAYADVPRNATHCQGQDDQSFRDIGQPATHSQYRKLGCPSDQV